MKTAFLLGLIAVGAGASLLTAQTAMASLEAAKISTAKSMPIPRYLVYRHFLAWVNDLDKKNAGASDPYQFAKPFAAAHLANSDLDALRRRQEHSIPPSPRMTAKQEPLLPNTGQKRRTLC